MDKMKYMGRLITTTPHFVWVIILQVLSGFATIAGIPMLIPALDYLRLDGDGSAPVGSQGVLNAMFGHIGIEPSFNRILFLAAFMIILGQCLLFASTIVASVAQLEISMNYRKKIFRSYSSVNWLWLTGDKAGKMNHAVLREADAAGVAHLNAQRVLIYFIQIVVFLFLSVQLSPLSTLIAFLVFGVLFFINSRNTKHVHGLSEKFNEAFKKIATATANLLQNKKFFKSSLLYEGVLKKIFDYIDETVRTRKRIALREEFQNSWNSLTTVGFIICLLVFRRWLGLGFSELLVMLLVFQRLGPQFNSLSAAYLALNNQIPIHRSLEERVMDLDRNREISGTEKFLFDQPIRLDNVFFKYPGGKTVVNGISLEIKPFTTVAFVGSSGGGKSTLLDLILGLLKPDSGNIYYGDIPQERLNANSFRDNVAYVSQETTLLDGTLRENLVIGFPEATEETIISICERVRIDGLIASLPEGLDTEIGENGIKLSGGQRQRIALGRALLMNPGILIMDEATSELDTESERMIQEAMNELRQDMTIIMVAHRLSTVKYSDTIYVIEKGSVCEAGTYDDLLKKRGRFYQLDSMQNYTRST